MITLLAIVGLVLMAPGALVLIASDITGGITLSLHVSLAMEAAMYIGVLAIGPALWKETKTWSLKIGIILIALVAIDGLFATFHAWTS